MPSVGDCARAALAALDTDAGLPRAAKWVSERYRELSARTRLRHLQTFGEFVLPAPVNAGTCTVTPGSNKVFSDITAAAVWNTNLIGKFFRAQVSWYEIVDVFPNPLSATIVLKSAYAESASGAGTGYNIVQRYTTLPDGNIRFLGVFVHGRRRHALKTTNKMALDLHHPQRHLLSTGGPRVVADLGADPTTGVRRVEIYPYPNQTEQITYQFWKIAPDLSQRGTDPDQTLLPNEVDLALLKQGVLVDLYRYEMAKLLHNGQIEAASLMRNEARAQATTWESAIQDLIRADRGTEDVSFVLRPTGKGTGFWDDPLIEDAHDHVLANWPI